MASARHVLAHTSAEEPLARFVEPDARALLNQHADFAQFVFSQTHWVALAARSSFRFVFVTAQAFPGGLPRGPPDLLKKLQPPSEERRRGLAGRRAVRSQEHVA